MSYGTCLCTSRPAHCVPLQADVDDDNTATFYDSQRRRKFTKRRRSGRRRLRHPCQRCGLHPDWYSNGQPAKHHLVLFSMTKLDFLARNMTLRPNYSPAQLSCCSSPWVLRCFVACFLACDTTLLFQVRGTWCCKGFGWTLAQSMSLACRPTSGRLTPLCTSANTGKRFSLLATFITGVCFGYFLKSKNVSFQHKILSKKDWMFSSCIPILKSSWNVSSHSDHCLSNHLPFRANRCGYS